MDRIILGNVSGEEFDAYFKNLNWPGRMAFVRSRRSEIAELANPKILDTLCDYGYFNALLPLVSADKEAADAQIISGYALLPVLTTNGKFSNMRQDGLMLSVFCARRPCVFLSFRIRGFLSA